MSLTLNPLKFMLDEMFFLVSLGIDLGIFLDVDIISSWSKT